VIVGNRTGCPATLIVTNETLVRHAALAAPHHDALLAVRYFPRFIARSRRAILRGRDPRENRGGEPDEGCRQRTGSFEESASFHSENPGIACRPEGGSSWLASVPKVTTEYPPRTRGSHRARASEEIAPAEGTVVIVAQYSIFRPSCMFRGPLEDVTAPNPQENDPLQPGDPAASNGVVMGVAHAPPWPV